MKPGDHVPVRWEVGLFNPFVKSRIHNKFMVIVVASQPHKASSEVATRGILSALCRGYRATERPPDVTVGGRSS